MAETAAEHEPKFGPVEVIVVTSILLIPDGIGVAIVFLGLDDASMLELVFGPSLGLYYYFKGMFNTQVFGKKMVKKMGARVAVQIGGELAPYIGALPLYTATYLSMVWLDRHPEIEKAVDAAAALEGGVGKGGRGAAAGGAGAETGAETRKVGQEALASNGVGGTAEVRAGGSEGSLAAGGEGSRGGAGKKDAGPRRIGGGAPSGETDDAPSDGTEEEEERSLSPEQRELRAKLSGDFVGLLLRETLGTEWMSQIGSQNLGEKPLKFDPDRAMEPKRPAASGEAEDGEEMYNGKEVDLRKAA